MIKMKAHHNGVLFFMLKFNNDLGGTVTAHDCNCRCYLEYNLMTAEEFAKVTGKKVANDGNTLNINVSDKTMQ